MLQLLGAHGNGAAVGLGVVQWGALLHAFHHFHHLKGGARKKGKGEKGGENMLKGGESERIDTTVERRKTTRIVLAWIV